MVGDARELFWFLYLNNVQESVPREMVAATLRRIGMPEEEFIKIGAMHERMKRNIDQLQCTIWEMHCHEI